MTKKCSDACSSGCKVSFAVISVLMVLFLGTTIGSLYHDFWKQESFDPTKSIVRSGGKTFVAVENLTDEFKVNLSTDSSIVVADGKTWIPVEGTPIHLTVLNDANCTTGCEIDTQLDKIKTEVTPALFIEKIDISSPEGQKLITDFEIKTIPQFIFGEGADNFEKSGTKVFEVLAKNGILVTKEGKHLLDGAKVGFPTGKFLKDPEFDNANDPVVGKGSVTVVEFSDFQCPYSKLLHDKNKDLLDELLKDGKITYVFKDFPLSFHGEANFAHQAANCVLKKTDSQKYLEMKDKIFAAQSEWGGVSAEDSKKVLTGLANELGIDISACLDDKSVQEEIDADIAEGSSYGVSGTPGLFIGTQKISGAIEPDLFRTAVEEAGSKK